MTTLLADKVAVITGAATGIGRAVAESFSAEGAAVAILDIDADNARFAASQLQAQGRRAISLRCDVSEADSVDSAFSAVMATLGSVDFLINNAARHLRKYNQPFATLTMDEIRGLFDVNVLGVINCTLGCRELMRLQGGGVVVNMSSAAGFKSTTPYGVSKLAVRGLTIAFAHEFAADNIRVNCVAPTLVPTENVLAEFKEGDFEHAVSVRQMIRRRGTIEDVVATIRFLCSDSSSFITGETIRVTGGYVMSI